MFTADKLGLRWPDGVWAVKDVCAVFRPGTLTALIGRNGCGKTTLLRLLVGLSRPSEGAVSNPYGRPGLLSQNPSLWSHIPAAGHVVLPLRRVKRWTTSRAEHRAAQLFEQLGLTGTENRYPDQLSGGEQQRVALARMLAMEPQIICLDEVTSALDPAATGAIYEIVAGLRDAGRTVVASTHDLHFVKALADHVIYLEKGAVKTQGPPELVLSDRDDPFFSVLQQLGR